MAITPQNSGIVLRQQINHWLSNFASADYATQLTIYIVIQMIQNRHYSFRSTRRKPTIMLKSIYILAIGNGIKNTVLIQMGRKRELHNNSVYQNRFISISDSTNDFISSYRNIKTLMYESNTDFHAVLHLTTNIRIRCRIIAYLNYHQAQILVILLNIFFQILFSLCGNSLTINHLLSFPSSISSIIL